MIVKLDRLFDFDVPLWRWAVRPQQLRQFVAKAFLPNAELVGGRASELHVQRSFVRKLADVLMDVGGTKCPGARRQNRSEPVSTIHRSHLVILPRA